MALIACPESGTQVSSLAAACPKCAAPIASAEAAKTVGQQVTTTEVTSKKFKRMQVIALLLSAVGVILMVSGGGASAGESGVGVGAASGIGLLMLLAGLVMFLVARIRAWWHHG